MMDTRQATCTRCAQIRETIFVTTVRPGGYGMFSVSTELPEPPKTENVCAICLTDDEVAQMLHPVVDFVLDTMPRHTSLPETSRALDTVAAYFKVRSFSPDGCNRGAALRAVGFRESLKPSEKKK